MSAGVITAKRATVHLSSQSNGYKIDKRVLYDEKDKRVERKIPLAYGDKYVDEVDGVSGTLLYNITAVTGESGQVELYILVGWHWQQNAFYFGLVGCERGDQAVWRSPPEFRSWFNRSSDKFLVDDQHNVVCWSVFDADRFALSAAFNGETATIDLMIQDTTQHITRRPLELAAVNSNKEVPGKAAISTESSSKMKKLVPTIRKSIRSLTVNIDVAHQDIGLCRPVVYPNAVPESLVSNDIVRMGRPCSATFQGSPLSTIRGFLMYRLVKRTMTNDKGYDFGQAALLGRTHIYLVIGWKIPALKPNKTCAFMVQFEEDMAPSTDKDKEQFLNSFISMLLGSEHEVNAYALDHGIRFQMLAKTSSQTKFNLSVRIAPLGEALGARKITNENFESYAGFVSYYPNNGFMCSINEARAKIISELNQPMKKTASHRLLHLVENRSSNLQLQYLDADTGKNIPAKLLRQNEYDYSITPVVDDKHWIHRVFELVPRTARSATDPDEKEQQTFLVIGNEAFTSTMSMVFCWTARDKKMSGPQVRHFVEEIEAMQLFIAGSLQVQSFIDHNLDRFSIVGYKTISSPHVMTVTLDDGIQNEQICKAELPCCLEVIIENRHPSVILDSPHIMSIGSKFIKGMSAMQAKLNGRISHMFNALPMEGCLGRGVRVSYALQYCNKDGTVIDNNNKSVHITWKADLEGTNKHNEAYSAYMHFTSGTEKYHDEESSETIYSRRGYNDSAPNSTVIETYVHGPVRCFVALILLSGNRATAASRLYILTTSSLDDIKKYTADLNRTTTRSGTIYGDPESDSDDENDN